MVVAYPSRLLSSAIIGGEKEAHPLDLVSPLQNGGRRTPCVSARHFLGKLVKKAKTPENQFLFVVLI